MKRDICIGRIRIGLHALFCRLSASFGNRPRLRNTQTFESVPPNNSDLKIFLEIHPECKFGIMYVENNWFISRVLMKQHVSNYSEAIIRFTMLALRDK